MKIVNALKLHTVISKNSISDAVEVLNATLAIFYSLTFEINMHLERKSS